MTQHQFFYLPLNFLKDGHAAVPRNWKTKGSFLELIISHIHVRETALVVQPKLFWLAASPDGLVIEKENENNQVGLLEIKSLKHSMYHQVNGVLT